MSVRSLISSRLFRFRTSGADAPAANPRWIEVDGGQIKGCWLFLDPAATAWQLEMSHGEFEPHLPDAIRSRMDPAGAVVWDVGGHVGYHALTFAEMVGSTGRVCTFEPSELNRARIEKNLSRNESLGHRIQLLPIALSDHDGTGTLRLGPNVDDGSSSGSMLDETLTSRNREVVTSHLRGVAVELARGDTLVAAGRTPPPQLVKIDVEGAEALVLAGMRNILLRHRPLVLLEVHSAAVALECAKLLHEVGYRIEMLKDDPESAARCHVIAEAASERDRTA